jgi:hypothetical protein
MKRGPPEISESCDLRLVVPQMKVVFWIQSGPLPCLSCASCPFPWKALRQNNGQLAFGRMSHKRRSTLELTPTFEVFTFDMVRHTRTQLEEMAFRAQKVLAEGKSELSHNRRGSLHWTERAAAPTNPSNSSRPWRALNPFRLVT